MGARRNCIPLGANSVYVIVTLSLLLMTVEATIASSNAGEVCPPHCNASQVFIPSQGCTPVIGVGFCCGVPDDLYCCTNYHHRVDWDLVSLNITRDDCVTECENDAVTSSPTMWLFACVLGCHYEYC